MADTTNSINEDQLGKTPAEQLKVVKDAIYAIMVGVQSYKIGSRQLTRADLAQLRAMKKELEAEAVQEQTDIFGDTFVGVFDGR